MNNYELVHAWKTGGPGAGVDHPAGEIRLHAVPTIAQRAMLLSGWSILDGIVCPDTWTLSSTHTG